jgi:hypothetical protein
LKQLREIILIKSKKGKALFWAMAAGGAAKNRKKGKRIQFCKGIIAIFFKVMVNFTENNLKNTPNMPKI